MYRLSPIAHRLQASGGQSRELNGYRQVPENGDESNHDGLGLFDRSHCQRAGFRGPGILEWLRDVHQIEAPAINHARETVEGLLVARLSQGEFMFLQSVEERPAAFEGFLSQAHDSAISEVFPEIYYLPRQDSHACFEIRGEHCSEMFAKLCGVDLRTESFADGQIAQTSMAHTGVIVIRRDAGRAPAYVVLVDSASAEYLWDCLEEAAKEFQPVTD